MLVKRLLLSRLQKAFVKWQTKWVDVGHTVRGVWGRWICKAAAMIDSSAPGYYNKSFKEQLGQTCHEFTHGCKGACLPISCPCRRYHRDMIVLQVSESNSKINIESRNWKHSQTFVEWRPKDPVRRNTRLEAEWEDCQIDPYRWMLLRYEIKWWSR